MEVSVCPSTVGRLALLLVMFYFSGRSVCDEKEREVHKKHHVNDACWAPSLGGGKSALCYAVNTPSKTLHSRTDSCFSMICTEVTEQTTPD